MADPLASEKAISYSEPPVYQSRDFVTVHQSERPTEVGKWWAAGEKFQISLRNIAQNELLDANEMFLEFGVVVENGAQVGAVPALDAALPWKSHADACMSVPTVKWGVPFFSSVVSSIPGIGSDKWLEADKASQSFCAARLLCSSGVGGWEESWDVGRVGYKIAGKPEQAGAKSIVSRMQCASVNSYINLGLATSRLAGPSNRAVLYYSIPLSMFSRTLNQCSNLCPISYYSSGSDLITFSFDLAPVSSVVNDKSLDYPLAMTSPAYYVIDPTISFTKTQINSASVLSVLEAMFRGVASVPVAPGVSAPIPMVQKCIDYSTAFTTVSNSEGAFQLNIPANQPSVRGVLIKICADGGFAFTDQVVAPTGARVVTQHSAQYLLEPSVRIRNFQLRIGSMRVPLDSLSDALVPISVPPGRSSGAVRAVTNDFVSRKVCARLYNAGKHLFSPFASEEDVHGDVMSMFHELPVGAGFANIKAYMQGYQYNAAPAVIIGTGDDKHFYSVSDALSPNLFVLPFESFASVFNMRDDAFALRGLDLRNISQITVSGILEAVVLDGISTATGKLTPAGGTWSVRGVLAYDVMEVLLSGRIDREAQFSLLQSGATAVPAGGNPSM